MGRTAHVGALRLVDGKRVREELCPYCRAPVEAFGARCGGCGLAPSLTPAAPVEPAPPAEPWAFRNVEPVAPPPFGPPPFPYGPTPVALPGPHRSTDHTRLAIILALVIGLVTSCAVGAVATVVLVGSDTSSDGDLPVNGFADAGLIVDRPLLQGDTVVVRRTAAVEALDRTTRRSRWSVPVCPEGQWADPTRMTADAVIAVQCDDTVMGLARADGTLLWTAPLTEVPDYARSTATTLVLGFESRVAVWDLATGQPRWEKAGLGPGGHPVAVDDERVYVTEGQSLAAYGVEDGSERWQSPVDVGTMALQGSTLYVREYLHSVSAIDTATGTTLWTSDDRYDALTHTVILGITAGHLVLRGDSTVIAFSLTTHRLAWTGPPGYGFADAGSLVLMTDHGLEVTDVLRGSPVGTDPGVVSEYAPAFDASGIVTVAGSEVMMRPLPR